MGAVFLYAVDLLLQRFMVFGGFDVVLFHMVEGAGEEAAGTARRIHDRLAQFRVDAIDHKARYRTWGIELTRIPGALQVAQDLFVDIAKQMAFWLLLKSISLSLLIT